MMDEYDVTFATKEWLISHGWRVVAFNPPGAQGTFTIPNPAKVRGYRGQTGSLSPDLVAVKDSYKVVIIESKRKFSPSDVNKLARMIGEVRRKKLIVAILEMVCKANEIPFDVQRAEIVPGTAHIKTSTAKGDKGMFLVELVKPWDSSSIVPPLDTPRFFRVTPSV